MMNTDPEVMEFFPGVLTEEETGAFVERMKKQLTEKGFCYFAVDRLDNGNFIGFIGISEKTFEADFTPCMDIGWRLDRKEWDNGFATEGAKECLRYAFDMLNLPSVFSFCPVVNKKSEWLMQKIGMKKMKIFDHPQLEDDERLKTCMLYLINKEAAGG